MSDTQLGQTPTEAPYTQTNASTEPSYAPIHTPLDVPDAQENPSFAGESQTAPAGESAQPLFEQAKQQASQVVEKTQQQAGQAMEQAKEKTRSWLDQQMDSTSDGLREIAGAVRQTGQQLRDKGAQPYGQYADFAEGAADAVERVSGYLRDNNVDQVVTEVETFARRQPVLFLSLAAGLGFLAARFLKSSGRSVAASGYNPDRNLPVVIPSEAGAGGDYGNTSPAG